VGDSSTTSCSTIKAQKDAEDRREGRSLYLLGINCRASSADLRSLQVSFRLLAGCTKLQTCSANLQYISLPRDFIYKI
jgi:hypothetical protein